MARAVSSSCPIPGPMATALYRLRSVGWAKYRSWMSVCTIASGTVVCSRSWLCSGTCTVSSPMPERRHACAASMEAPAMPYEPAMSKPCPKLPLCANRFRGFTRRLISASSTMLYVLGAASMYDCFSPMSSSSHWPTMSSFSGKRNESLGNCMLSVMSA